MVGNDVAGFYFISLFSILIRHGSQTQSLDMDEDAWFQALQAQEGLGDSPHDHAVDDGGDSFMYSPESPVDTPDFLDAPDFFGLSDLEAEEEHHPASPIDIATGVDHEGPQVALDSDSVPAKRSRAGRPKGTTKSFLQWDAQTRASREATVEPQPHSIARAREFRKQKQERCKQEQQSQLEASRAPTIEALVGDTTQRSLWGMCCHAWTCREQDKSEALPENTTGNKQDPVVTALLDGAAVSASCKGVQRLMHQPHGVKDLLFQVGAAIFAFGSWMWAVFLSHVLNKCTGSSSSSSLSDPCWRAVLVICKLRYDETPSKVRVSVTESGDHKILGKNDHDEACTHAKVVQSEHVQAALFQNLVDKSFVFCTSRLPTHLCAVDRTTGENTRSVLWQQISAMPEFLRISHAFDLKVRISVADRYPANIRAERGLQQNGFLDHFVNLFFPCDVHKLHSSIKNASSIEKADFDIAGLLNTGLACIDLGSTRALRAILISILDSELEIIHACPPLEPESKFNEYRQGVFNLYLPQHDGIPRGKKKTHAKIRFILSYFLNGDLTSHKITHYCPRGCCKNEDSCRENIAHFLAWALIPRKLPVLSRKTWTGFHDSLAWVGVLASHHNLFERVMEMYIGKPTEPLVHEESAPKIDESWLGLMLASEPGPLGNESSKVDPADSEQKHPSVANQNPLQQESKTEEDDAPVDEPEWVKKKRQSKRTARDWVATQPGVRVAVLTDSLEPLFTLMNKFLKMSGVNWRKQQERSAFVSKKRTYAVVEAALGKDVEECKIQVGNAEHQFNFVSFTFLSMVFNGPIFCGF